MKKRLDVTVVCLSDIHEPDCPSHPDNRGEVVYEAQDSNATHGQVGYSKRYADNFDGIDWRN